MNMFLSLLLIISLSWGLIAFKLLPKCVTANIKKGGWIFTKALLGITYLFCIFMTYLIVYLTSPTSAVAWFAGTFHLLLLALVCHNKVTLEERYQMLNSIDYTKIAHLRIPRKKR